MSDYTKTLDIFFDTTPEGRLVRRPLRMPEGVKRCKGNKDSCSICLEELTVGSAAKTPCGHVFHRCCIERWVDKSNNCPLCRGAVPRKVTFQGLFDFTYANFSAKSKRVFPEYVQGGCIIPHRRTTWDALDEDAGLFVGNMKPTATTLRPGRDEGSLPWFEIFIDMVLVGKVEPEKLLEVETWTTHPRAPRNLYENPLPVVYGHRFDEEWSVSVKTIIRDRFNDYPYYEFSAEAMEGSPSSDGELLDSVSRIRICIFMEWARRGGKICRGRNYNLLDYVDIILNPDYFFNAIATPTAAAWAATR